MPDLHIALCKRCHLRTWQRSLRSLALAVVVVLSGTAAARLTFIVWPWVYWPVLVLSACFGIAMGWTLASMLIGRLAGSFTPSGWHGVPARVVHMTHEGWTLHVVSDALAASLEPVAVHRPVERSVLESDAAAPGLAGVLTVVGVATVLWFAWHPAVRVVNVTGAVMEIVVDGRSLALIAGVPGEAPSAGAEIRVPEGRRVLRALRLDGELVDETVGWIGLGRAQLYAPGSQGRCFWVEQKAYGRARQPRPEVVHLPADRRFHTFPMAIDAWFQPNPPTEPNVWFSGGVRRTVRLGECPAGDAH